MHAKFLQSCPTLCDPMDGDLPGSSLHGISQARILQWAALLQGDLADSGIEPTSLMSPALSGGFFTTEPPGGGRSWQSSWMRNFSSPYSLIHLFF